jgi:hypothetical protein
MEESGLSSRTSIIVESQNNLAPCWLKLCKEQWYVTASTDSDIKEGGDQEMPTNRRWVGWTIAQCMIV